VKIQVTAAADAAAAVTNPKFNRLTNNPRCIQLRGLFLPDKKGALPFRADCAFVFFISGISSESACLPGSVPEVLREPWQEPVLP
jgi:hypothetical protein